MIDAVMMDIVIAARAAQGHIAALTKDAFLDSGLHQDAVVRQLEIIGEAARLVPAAFRAEHPEIPWKKIVAMRNELIHAYRSVDVEQVWETVVVDLPALIQQLAPLIPADPL